MPPTLKKLLKLFDGIQILNLLRQFDSSLCESKTFHLVHEQTSVAGKWPNDLVILVADCSVKIRVCCLSDFVFRQNIKQCFSVETVISSLIVLLSSLFAILIKFHGCQEPFTTAHASYLTHGLFLKYSIWYL